MKKATLLKQARSLRRRRRVGAKLFGTAHRPRLVVTRSLQHISCQLIDDATGHTLVSVSDITVKATGNKTERAKQIGTAIAQAAQAKKITAVVFDRSGHLYHGRVKALAEAARAAGLHF